VLLHKGDFVMLESQNGVWLTQQMCYIRILFHDCSMIKMKVKSDVLSFSKQYGIGFLFL
jgi:hypothetical protein